MHSGHRRVAALRGWAVIVGGAAILSGVIPMASARASGPTFTGAASLPVPRAGPGVATGPDGDIYTVGGFNQGWPIWETDDYDANQSTWTSVAQYPDARSDLGVTTGQDGLIYAFGGQAYAFQITADMYAYNTVTNTWTARAPMPSARYAVGAATGPDGLIYAIGGEYASGKLYGTEPPTIKASAEVDAYDPRTNLWKKLQPLPQAYGMPSAATGADGRIYVFEGCTGAGCASLPGQPVKGSMSPQLLAYDVHTNRWTQLATPPLPRTWAAMTTGADGRLYVLGPGLYVSNDNSAEVYDPATNGWSVVPSLAVTTSGIAVTTGKDGRVYAIGGIDPTSGKSLTDVRTFPTFQGATSAPLIENIVGLSSGQRYVAQLYSDILKRAWDNGGAYLASKLDRGQVNGTQAAMSLVESTEYVSDQVNAMYLTHLGRAADSAGLAYWVGFIQHALGTYEDLEVSFLGAPEYYANAGGTPDGFLSRLYADVFNRDLDPGGRTYWDAHLAAGTPAWVVAMSVVMSTEAMQNRVSDAYWQMLGRAPDSAGLDFWTSKLQGGARDENLVAFLAGSDEYWQKTQAR